MKMKNLLFIVLMIPLFAFAQPTSQTFNANGNYVVPIGYSAELKVEVWGSGAGGSSATPGGGGGGGAYAQKIYMTVLPGSYPVVVGLGGTANGAGNSSIYNGALTANGGATSAGLSGGLGGSASGGDINNSGGAGGTGIDLTGTNNDAGGGGGGSANSMGPGTAGGDATSGVGGSGGSGSGVGGTGAAGGTDATAGGSIGAGGAGRGKNSTSASAGAAGRVTVSVLSFLPVELISFSAILERNQVFLAFKTATEYNNDYFSIERSADGKAFTSIGELDGQGTSTEIQNYSFSDERPLKGLNYYRLSQVDYDGKSEYSKIVSVTNGRTGTVTIAPSPAVDEINISFDAAITAESRYEVFDQSGKVVLNGDVGEDAEVLDLDVSYLMTGIYALRVINDREVMTKQFFKQ
jgi:hypothetical protein